MTELTKRQIYMKKYDMLNKEKQRAYRKEYNKVNEEKQRAYHKEYHIKNRDAINARTAKYDADNPERRPKYNKEYWRENKDRIYAYKKKRRENDLHYKIREYLRARMWRALKDQGGEKIKSVLALTGCDLDELKEHLEGQFTDGMTWENYGKWHIDHIIPCASFDLLKESEQKKCFHYTNLQPLWEDDNKSKGHWR